MKKIALASAAMGGAALIAFGASGTFAALSDSNTQTLSAGAGTLSVGIDRPATLPAQAGNLAPGDKVIVPFYVKNTGQNVAGKVGVALKNLVNNENGCSSISERTAETAKCDAAGDVGEFGGAATYRVGVSKASGAACDANATPDEIGYIPFALDAGLTPAASPVLLAAGGSTCVLVEIALPKTTTGNNVQGDSMRFDAVVTLEQA